MDTGRRWRVLHEARPSGAALAFQAATYERVRPQHLYEILDDSESLHGSISQEESWGIRGQQRSRVVPVTTAQNCWVLG